MEVGHVISKNSTHFRPAPRCSRDQLQFSTSSSLTAVDRTADPVSQDCSFLESSWRNPNPMLTLRADPQDHVTVRNNKMRMASSSTDEGSSGSDNEVFRMMPSKGGSRDHVTRSCDHVAGARDRKLNPRSCMSDSNKGGLGGSLIDSDKLAADLSSIIPTFDFSPNSPNLFAGGASLIFPWDSLSGSSTSSNPVIKELDMISYASSYDCDLRTSRHSWAGNLDIIDVTSDSLEYHSKRKLRHRRKDSFDRSFSVKKRPAPQKRHTVCGTLNGFGSVIKFESQACAFDSAKSRMPGLKYIIRGKSLSTSLILEQQRLTIKFTSRKDYFYSSVKKEKQKLVLHLLDVKNVLVLTDSNTLIIQFTESSKSKVLPKDRLTLDKMSDTMRSSRSTSLNRSTLSACDHEISEIEVGRFNNCKDVAAMILKRRQDLLPKGILKRGSIKRKKLEPQLITPIEQDGEVTEFLTYV